MARSLSSSVSQVCEAEIQGCGQAIGGEYREMLAFKGRVGTVHPLGGCSMADDPACGVVDHRGRVFDGWHGGYAESGQGTRPSTADCT